MAYQNIVLSIGGSVIYPDAGINTHYLTRLNKLVRNLIKDKTVRVVLFTGGGHVAREYQYCAERVIGKVRNEDLNWLGVHSTRLNAHLMRTIFHDVAYPKVLARYDKVPSFGEHQVVICAAWLPGASTDFDMVNLAKVMKIKKVYSLINVAGIYTRDPKIFSDAQLVKSMNWADYREMIGDWWNPKRQVPFDPFASKLAEDQGLKVYFVEGKNLDNLQRALNNQDFVGTIIG